MIEIAERQGLVIDVGHTFLYSAPVRKIVEIRPSRETVGGIRYINSRRPEPGTLSKRHQRGLGPGSARYLDHPACLGEMPLTVNCQGNAHVTQGIEDVTNISLSFRQSALLLFRAVGSSPEDS